MTPDLTPAMTPAMTPADPAGFRVIETFGWDGVRFARLHSHLARMARTCARFAIPFDPMQVLVRLDAVPDGGPLRIRVTVAVDGRVELTHAPLSPVVPTWRVGVAPERLVSDDPWLTVKTTQRGLYDRVRARLPAGIDEMLFLNQRGEVCEGTVTSVFFDAGQGLCTPPLVCGLLPGILRAEMIETGRCREALLLGDALADARLWLGNSLRGLIPAELGMRGE